MRKHSFPPYRGVTLVEVLVVIVVLGILAAIATPSMQEMLERRRLIGATEAIYDQVILARSEAIKQGRDTYVRLQPVEGCVGINDLPDPTADRCDCTQTDPRQEDACTLLVHGEEEDGRVLQVLLLTDFREVSMAAPTTAVNVRFNFVRGIVVGTGRTITLSTTPKNYRLNVVVSSFGRVRICAPTDSRVGGYPSCS